MTTRPRQSRSVSFAEAAANVVAGFLVAMTAQQVVFPLFGIATTLRVNAGIAVVFTRPLAPPLLRHTQAVRALPPLPCPLRLSMARPSHRPDPQTRRQVEAMAGYGVPEADIAGVVGVSPKTLRKHYRSELDHGHVKANAKVAESLFRKATGEGPQSVTAAIFWLKTRAGWKETSVHEIGGSSGNPVQVEVASAREILQRRLAEIASRLPPPEERAAQLPSLRRKD